MRWPRSQHRSFRFADVAQAEPSPFFRDDATRSYLIKIDMANTHLQPHPQFTAADRLILGILRNDYERSQRNSAVPYAEEADDSDDSGVKHTRFDSASPEGMTLPCIARPLYIMLPPVSDQFYRHPRSRTAGHRASQRCE